MILKKRMLLMSKKKNHPKTSTIYPKPALPISPSPQDIN